MALIFRPQGQTNHKTSAALGVVFTHYRAAMANGNGFHQRQAQAHAAIAFGGARQAVKRLKNALSQRLWHTGPPVTHGDDGLAPFLPQRDGDPIRSRIPLS